MSLTLIPDGIWRWGLWKTGLDAIMRMTLTPMMR